MGPPEQYAKIVRSVRLSTNSRGVAAPRFLAIRASESLRGKTTWPGEIVDFIQSEFSRQNGSRQTVFNVPEPMFGMSRLLAADLRPDTPDCTLDPDAIAQTYIDVLRQPRSAWSLVPRGARAQASRCALPLSPGMGRKPCARRGSGSREGSRLTSCVGAGNLTPTQQLARLTPRAGTYPAVPALIRPPAFRGTGSASECLEWVRYYPKLNRFFVIQSERYRWAGSCQLQSFSRRGPRGAVKRAVGNFLGLLRHVSRQERIHVGGNAVSGSAVWPFNVVDKAHPDVFVDRAPVGQDVHSVTGKVGFACADFQRSRAHWAQGRGFRQLHDCLHASQQPDPARATRRESMSGRASHRSSKNIFVQKLLKTKFSYCSFVSTV